MVTTCAVTCTAHDQNGNPEVGATVRARLDRYDVDGGYIVPEDVVGTTDANGECVLELWPNQRGSTSSMYEVTIVGEQGETLRTTAVIPDSATANLHEVAALPPYAGEPGFSPMYDPQAIRSDAFSRANHTGTQPISSVASLQSTLDAKLIAGSFGLGATGGVGIATNVDDTTIPNGTYRTLNTATGTFPTAVTGYAAVNLFGVLRVHRYDASTVYQEYEDVINELVWRRTYRTGSWRKWRLYYATDNVVGIVSDDAGANVGAIVQRGTTAAGYYQRLADGTQMCWGQVATSSSAEVTTTWPIAFSTTSNLSIQLTAFSGGSLSIAPKVSALSTTTFGCAAWNNSNARLATAVYYHAIGRWK